MHVKISPELVIIAACARPYAVAAVQAGYQVAAFDIFNDIETRRCCLYSSQIKFSRGGFDAADLLGHLAGSDLTDATVLYGSGLEGQPELLEQLAARYRLLGNSPFTVATIKRPQSFFTMLDALTIKHPETVFEVPPSVEGWLSKSAGGSGGTHVRRGAGVPGDYYQREVAGQPVSVLFLADGDNIEIVGFNEQWLAPTAAMPYRYGGALGHADFSASAKTVMAAAAAKVTAATGLCGLNSMDFVLTDQEPLALEVNPRLSASFDLYAIPDLLERHMQACQGKLDAIPQGACGSQASLICYASRDVDVIDGMNWPEWATDIPPVGSAVMAGEPLCSVRAAAPASAEAKALAFARARQLDAQWQPLKT